MADHVWGYWDCPYCNTKGIRGDNRHCPSCGTPIPPDVRYYMQSGVREEVSEAEKNDEANWICEYCSAQNDARDTICKNCGSPREEAERDYFGNAMNGAAPAAVQQSPPPAQSGSFIDGIKSFFDLRDKRKRRRFIIIAGIVLFFGFVSWLYTPITRSSVIESFEWERITDIEEFRNIEESGWSLPPEAHLRSKRDEIHHYDQVLDHYEQKTRRVSHQVQDGYDISYRDLGNGQFEEVRTPRYRTEWEDETYEEPVYRSVPVYKTKYYYDIDRWIYSTQVAAAGQDHSPHWYDTGLTADVADPVYGDRRERHAEEHYYAVISDPKGSRRVVEYSESDWNALNIGDEITYRTFRYSYEPID